MRLLMIFFLLFTQVQIGLAVTSTESGLEFEVKAANKQFDRLNLQLSTHNLNPETLKTAIATLSKLNVGATQCVDDAQKKLNNIELLIQQGAQPTEANHNSTNTGADLVYLHNEQRKISAKQAQCRLFSIRAKEAIDAYQATVAQLKQAETLARGKPLWLMLNGIDRTFWSNLIGTFSPLASVFPTNAPWLGLALTCFLISTFLLFRIHNNKLARRYIRLRKRRIGHWLLLSTWLFVGLSYLSVLYRSFEQPIIPIELMRLFLLVFGYLSLLLITIIVFKLKKTCVFFYWNSLDVDFFRSLTIFLLSFYLIELTEKLHIVRLFDDNLILQVGQSLFLLAILSTAIYFLYYFCHLHRHLKFIKHHHRLITQVGALLFSSCILLNLFGYYTLALRLTFSVISTFSIVFLATMLSHGIGKLYLTLEQNLTLNQKIRFYFGYKQDHLLMEFFILRTTLQVIVIAASLYWIVKMWGFATYYLETAYTQFLYGIHFGNFTFYPIRIVAGIIIYCLIYLAFRALSTAISHHQQFEDEEERQVAFASILTYLGFGIAIASGLLIAGFDFTGLALVAGALSVGIGLGLQSIVNNFVSGLILLIEKPIKPGDRINVNGVEGVVKKIRVRSTQILTPAREDIIIPNSDLITRQVTNYMYTDKQLSIYCEVGVAYGTSTELVKDLLLNIANSHDEIIKSTRHKPKVLLRSFGENNLIFQLWFLIKDANKKAQIQSDVYFLIEAIFRENQIQMAYPQRDIHLNLSESKSLLSELTKKNEKISKKS